MWIANLMSNVGGWMQTTGAAWEMTSLTQEPIFVALLAAAGTLPMFLFCFFAGILADRFDRRRYIIGCQVWMMGVAATLAVLAYFGQLNHWNLLALSFCMGLGNAMNAPAWHAVVPEIVTGPQLRPAIALNSAGFNLARTIGPVIGQLLLGEEAREAIRRIFAQQPLDASDLDRVDSTPLQRARAFAHLARSSTAALVPAKPRHSTSAIGLRGTCGCADTDRPAHSGSSSRSVAMPGTTLDLSAASATTVSTMPAAAIRCPNDHLSPVTGGMAGPNTRRIATASEASDARVPLPCATIIPTFAAATPASSSACSIARVGPSPSARMASRPRPSVA